MVATARGILEKQGLLVPGLHHTALTFQTFESNVLYTLRFMVDRGVVGGNWVELPAGSYAHRAKKQSMCQYECDVRYDKVVSHAPEGQYSKLAPFRILSMDIECAGRKGHFPDAEHDPVIQIATMVRFGRGKKDDAKSNPRDVSSPSGSATVSLPRSSPAEGENQTDGFLFLLSSNRR